jgi:hypothetical protein
MRLHRHHPPTRCSLLLLASLLGAAGPLSAQTPEPTSPARFFIETITVEGLEAVSSDIVLSTSLLHEGETYSERRLRDAISRIVRLPLVLDAELALRRGSERGRFELVITVWEARRWFFAYEMESTRWREPLPGVTGQEHDDRDAASLAGRRFSVGRHGVFFLAVPSIGFSDVDGFEISPEVGYTHYNLFGRNVLFNVSYSLASCDDDRTPEPGRGSSGSCETSILDLGLDPTLSVWSSLDTEQVALSLGVPLRGNQSLRFLANHSATDQGGRRFALEADFTSFTLFEDRINRNVSASWVFDSWDEVFLVQILDGAGERHEHVLSSFEELEGWWVELRLVLLASPVVGGGEEAKVVLDVIPFSRSEQLDTQRWLADSVSRGERSGGTPQGGDSLGRVFSVLIATSIQRRPVTSYRWILTNPEERMP